VIGTLRLVRGFIALAIPAILFLAPATSHSNCSGGGPAQMLGNVVWFMKDSLSACPAGDTVLVGDVRHPCRLRISIEYADVNCNPVVGVRPESIWVTVQSTTGNLKVNDEGAKIFADDSTDAGGNARITIPSFSGNGTISLKLWVSGVSQGTKSGVVRTTDSNADGRSASDDLNCGPCIGDINYDGMINGNDINLIRVHADPGHWHRNVLFGTLDRRTTTSGIKAPETFNTLGDDFGWSPSGRMLAVSIFDTVLNQPFGNCAINLIPADSTSYGTIPFSMPPHVILPHPSNHDYSPQWSPLGTTIFWNRGDFYMMYKGIYGQNPDTATYTVPITTSLTTMTEMSLSPDGSTLLFSGFGPGQHAHLFTVPISGGVPSALTADVGTAAHFAQWAPDGAFVFYQLGDGGTGTHIYKVAAGGGTPTVVDATDVGTAPFVSPDGAVILFAKGASSLVTATLDASLPSGVQPIVNYAQYTNPYYAEQKISPDGTRLAQRAVPPGHPTENAQLWAARRNMSLPPQFSAFGGQSFADSVAAIPISLLEGSNWNGTLVAYDPEGDSPLSFSAPSAYLQPGMAFTASTGYFAWTPPLGTAGKTFNVKFVVATPSGGTDSFIAQFSVHHPTTPNAARRSTPSARRVSTNPVRERFEISGNFSTAGARLEIFDVSGTRVARIGSTSPGLISWNLRSDTGRPMGPGVYFYRVSIAGEETRGKIVLVR
jgi:Tol biopolymer transport system component